MGVSVFGCIDVTRKVARKRRVITGVSYTRLKILLKKKAFPFFLNSFAPFPANSRPLGTCVFSWYTFD